MRKIQSLNEKVQEFKYADSLGVDFHKTGFCPYVSSLFIVRNRDDFYNFNPSKKILKNYIMAITTLLKQA